MAALTSRVSPRTDVQVEGADVRVEGAGVGGGGVGRRRRGRGVAGRDEVDLKIRVPRRRRLAVLRAQAAAPTILAQRVGQTREGSDFRPGATDH